MSSRRELTDHEKRVALKAKQLWLEKKRRDKTTQMEANKALGWSPSVFGQYISGRMAMGPKAVAKLADYLGVSPYEIDPDLAKDFVPPPSDMVSVEDSLSRMSVPEINRLVSELSRRLPEKDKLRLVALLVDRLLSER